MLWVLDKHGQSYIPDIVMSVTSMVKHQTNGAAMDLMRAKLAVRNGMAIVESDCQARFTPGWKSAGCTRR